MGDVELFLGGALTAGLSLDCFVTFGQAERGGGFDCSTPQRPPTLPCPYVLIIRDSSIVVLRRAALALFVQVGHPSPDALPSPDPPLRGPGYFSCLSALRFLFLARAIWISDYSADVRLPSDRFCAAERPRCCVFVAGKTILTTALNHLRWGVTADSDLLRPPGSAWADKG